jgi:hypothetical protein
MALEYLSEARSLLFCCDDNDVIEEVKTNLKSTVEKLRTSCPVLSHRVAPAKRKPGRKKQSQVLTRKNVKNDGPKAQERDEIDRGLFLLIYQCLGIL